MRGKGWKDTRNSKPVRITPAYAGKSAGGCSGCCSCRDHPRVCGEKNRTGSDPSRSQGSPPRMRGKDSSHMVKVVRFGITPAYAGKRKPANTGTTSTRDHPRVCGEKLTTFDAGKLIPGSPPRMRGKDIDFGFGACRYGITPAYAGKRVCETTVARPLGDHPRVCGEKRNRKRQLCGA